MRVLRLLLTVMALVWPRGVASDTLFWRRIQQPTDLFSTQGRTQTFTLRSYAKCAMKASTSPWSYMFKYEEEECILYDKKEDSQGDLKLSDASVTSNIFTRLHNVCIEGDDVYLEGDEKLDVDCRQQRCTNRTFELVIYAPGLPCRAPFEAFQGGCFYLHLTEMNWCEARQHCVSLGGDLAYSPSFEAIRDFLSSHTPKDVWIGGRYRKWLDTREMPTTPEQHPWSPSDPNGDMNECVRMHHYKESHVLADKNCEIAFIFLCQLV